MLMDSAVLLFSDSFCFSFYLATSNQIFEEKLPAPASPDDLAISSLSLASLGCPGRRASFFSFCFEFWRYEGCLWCIWPRQSWRLYSWCHLSYSWGECRCISSPYDWAHGPAIGSAQVRNKCRHPSFSLRPVAPAQPVSLAYTAILTDQLFLSLIFCLRWPSFEHLCPYFCYFSSLINFCVFLIWNFAFLKSSLLVLAITWSAMAWMTYYCSCCVFCLRQYSVVSSSAAETLCLRKRRRHRCRRWLCWSWRSCAWRPSLVADWPWMECPQLSVCSYTLIRGASTSSRQKAGLHLPLHLHMPIRNYSFLIFLFYYTLSKFEAEFKTGDWMRFVISTI